MSRLNLRDFASGSKLLLARFADYFFSLSRRWRVAATEREKSRAYTSLGALRLFVHRYSVSLTSLNFHSFFVLIDLKAEK